MNKSKPEYVVRLAVMICLSLAALSIQTGLHGFSESQQLESRTYEAFSSAANQSNGSEAAWTSRTSVLQVFGFDDASLVSPTEIDQFRDAIVDGEELIQIEWRGSAYTLIVVDEGSQSGTCSDHSTTPVGNQRTQFTFYGTSAEHEWASFVSIYIGVELITLHLRLLEPGMDLWLIPWEGSWMSETFSDLGGEHGDYIIFDDLSLWHRMYPDLDYQNPTFPPFANTPTDIGSDIPPLGVSPGYDWASMDLIRIGVYLDEKMYQDPLGQQSSLRIELFCSALYESAGIIFAETGGKVQVEIVKELKSRNWSAEGGTVPGYKDWGLSAASSQAAPLGSISANFQRFDAYGNNGYNWPHSVNNTDLWTSWNGGRFRDINIFGLYDEWWDWNQSLGRASSLGNRICNSSPPPTSCDPPNIARTSVIRVDEHTQSFFGPPIQIARSHLMIVRTMMQEMGHNMGLFHEDGECREYFFPLPIISHRTVMTNLSCSGAAFNVNTYSQRSIENLTDPSNEWGVIQMPVNRTMKQPNSAGLLEVGGNALLYNLIDWIPPVKGAKECRTQYRVEFALERTGVDVMVMEFFNSVRSSFRRIDVNGNPVAGQWDFWLGYDRSENHSNETLLFRTRDSYTFHLSNGTYHGQPLHNDAQTIEHGETGQIVAWYGSGFIRDDDNARYNEPMHVDRLGCSFPSRSVVHLNHHPFQNDTGPHSWTIHPVINVGNNYSAGATYNTFSAVAITIMIDP